MIVSIGLKGVIWVGCKSCPDNELAQTLDGSYVMLHRWIVANKQMAVEVYLVNQNMVWTAIFLW